MATLIALLISLLGYGTPAEFEQYTEAELEAGIEYLQDNAQADGGNGIGWDTPEVVSEDNTGN